MQPIISVIVASYNYEKYIQETLSSLVRQTDQRFEVIVVDDGSADKSVEVIEQYTNAHHNIYLYTHQDNKNMGLAATVRLGIEKARGQYIAFCESDDYWSDNHVELLHKTIESNPDAKFIANAIQVVNQSSTTAYEAYSSFCSRFLRDHSGSNIFEAMSSNMIPTFSAVCVERDTLLECDFNSPFAAWLDFWLWRQICVCNKLYFIDQQITLWRKHDTSFDATSQDKDFVKFLEISDLYIHSKYREDQIPTQIELKWRKYPKFAVKLYCCFIRSKDDRRYIRYKHIRSK